MGGSGECEHPHMRTSECPQWVPVEHHLGPILVGGLEGRWDGPGSGSQPRAQHPVLHRLQAEDVPMPSGSLLGIWLLKSLFPAAFYSIYVASKATFWSRVPSHHSQGRLDP